MKKALKILGLALGVVLIGGVGYLAASSGLKSDPAIGLSPETHKMGRVDVRAFTPAPLGAEVKVYLPMPVEAAISIVADFDRYGEWVAPAPAQVVVDDSKTADGRFGVGSLVSYKEGETDEIELFEPDAALIARPLWATEDLAGHRGVVLVTAHDAGSIIHMRRYFEVNSMKGWMMSKMMPIFMKQSAENLVEIHGGRVL